MEQPPNIEPIAQPNGLPSQAWAAFFDDLGRAATMASGPVGVLYPFPLGAAEPTEGFAPANGVPISRKDNPILFAKYGEFYGAGDGSTTFGVPNIPDEASFRWYVRVG